MNLDELKQSMATLEKVLEKTNSNELPSDFKIDVTTSKTAQAKLLGKFRQTFISCLILAFVFGCMIFGGNNENSFPVGLRIYFAVYLFLAGLWYINLYVRLRRIDPTTVVPLEVFTKTSKIKMLMISGELILGICLAVFFALLIPKVWTVNVWGSSLMIIAIIIGVILALKYYIPRYRTLFQEINSIKE